MANRERKKGGEGGYSLIELLVAIGLFSVVISVMTSMFMLSLRGQKKAFAVQDVADNTRYAMEIMSKEIRMGSVFPATGTLPFRFKSNMPNRVDGSGNPATVEFSLLNGQILFDDDTAGGPGPTAITSANINVTGLNFSLNPSGSIQKRVLITIQAGSAGTAAGSNSQINLETVIAPRILQQ